MQGLLLALGLALPAAAAAAETDENWAICAGSDEGRAIAACSALIRARGSDIPLAFYNRGIAWRLTRQFDRALADLNRAIQLQADFAAAYIERGIVRYEMRDYTRAIADADAAIRLKPDLAEAFNNRALARLNH